MRSSEKYWSEEGNNKRMQTYHKFSKALKIIDYVFVIGFVFYILVLCTNSLFHLFDNMINCVDQMELSHLYNFKSIVYNTYEITFITILIFVVYNLIKKKYEIKKVKSTLLVGMLFLPVSALLIYNFIMLGSLMSSFYLLVVFVVISWIIKLLTKRIDNLYDIAVGSIEIDKNRKGEKKCKVK